LEFGCQKGPPIPAKQGYLMAGEQPAHAAFPITAGIAKLVRNLRKRVQSGDHFIPVIPPGGDVRGTPSMGHTRGIEVRGYTVPHYLPH
jgi:hypothetical protein